MSRRKKQITELNLKKIGGRIAYIRISNDQTMAKFAEITGLSTGNLSALENYKYEPSFQAIVKIIENYNVNPGWLIMGEGEILRRDEKADTYIYKEGESQSQALDDDPEIAELVAMTIDVLRSETGYSNSLNANIRSFHHAIKTEARLKTMEGDIGKIKSYMGSDRRQTQRRHEDHGPPKETEERRSGKDRRKHAVGEN